MPRTPPTGASPAATYAEKLSAHDRELDAGRSATELERVVRALSPHIGARLRLSDGTLLGVDEARVLPSRGLPAGTVSPGARGPVLACAQGALELTVVQPPGKRPMSGEDFLRGHRA